MKLDWYWIRTMAAVIVALVPGLALAAGDDGGSWSGLLGVSYVGQDSDGSEESFRTQTTLDDGFLLDRLELRYEPAEGDGTRFELEASGFGDAEPTESARLKLQLSQPWTFALSYDNRESFFFLPLTSLGPRADDWEITRWVGEVEWQGWKDALLGLELRRHEREGRVSRPYFEFNEFYPLDVDLDESMNEVALRLETRTLPVKIIFEQAFAFYRQENRRQTGGTTNLVGTDPELLAGAETTREDEQETPTTRLSALYSSPRVELAGSFLWSPAELESRGLTSTSFDIGGGIFGTVEFIDDLLGAADMDTLNGDLRIGILLAPEWRLRLIGNYRDTATDSTLLGSRLLRLTNPFGGTVDIGGEITSADLLDETRQQGQVEIEWSRNSWSVWAGGHTGSRDVRYGLAGDEQLVRAERDSDGQLFGVSYRPSRKLFLSAEYERDTFDQFVFRTDPEDVDRLSLKLTVDVGEGWRLRVSGRFEDSDNPREQSNRQHSSDGLSASLLWNSSDGEDSFGLILNQTDLTTETALLLPGGDSGLSLYDLSLLAVTVHGTVAVGPARLSGTATRLDDGGDTFPLESWQARARISFDVGRATELSVFGEYWSYDEESADLADFDTTRYGLGVRRRFD